MTRFHVVCTLAVVSLANLTVAQAPSAQTQATTADVAVSSDAVEADEQPAVQRVAPTVVQNNCAEHALSTAMLSVVRVVSGQSHGSGVFVAPQLIVTALSVVERGHSIEVVDADGARHAAHISALDRSRGLALISVEAEGTPLPRANVVLGQRAVVLSAESSCSRDAHAQPVVQETVISSVRTDALGLGSLNHADIAGSAIVSCTGELLGIVARTGHGHGASFHGVPAVRAFDLIESRDRDRGYAGSFSGTIGLAAQMQFENNTRELMGLSLSMGVIGYDWAMLLARGAYLKAGESPGGTIAHREFERFRLDPILAGRIYVNVNEWLGFHIEVGGGASFSWSILNQQRAMLSAGNPTSVDFINDRLERFSVRPTGYLAFLFGNLEVSYQVFLGLETSSPTWIHSIGLGARSN